MNSYLLLDLVSATYPALTWIDGYSTSQDDEFKSQAQIRDGWCNRYVLNFSERRSRRHLLIKNIFNQKYISDIN